MLALTAADSGSGSSRVVSYVLLALLVVVVVLAIVRLKPKLRERRHQAWREAGPMPDQLDRSEDDR